MRRREFLMAGALAGEGIVDTHTHFYDPGRPEGVPWPPKSDALLYRRVMPEEFKALVRPLGVTGTVVVEASPWMEDNAWVLGLAARDPFLLGLVGRLPVGGAGFARELERFGANAKFLGIRMGEGVVREGLGSAAFVDDLKKLAGRGLMVDVLGGAGMLSDVVRLAERVEGLRIVIDHMPFEGGVEESVLQRVAAVRSVWVKVSNVMRRGGPDVRGLDVLWDVFGAERLMYGSNWPVSLKMGRYEEALGAVRAYFEGKGVAAAFFRENARAAYRFRE